MTATLKRIAKSKASAKASKRRVAPPSKSVKPPSIRRGRSLAELNRWMDENVKEIVEGVRLNTLEITGGKESL